MPPGKGVVPVIGGQLGCRDIGDVRPSVPYYRKGGTQREGAVRCVLKACDRLEGGILKIELRGGGEICKWVTISLLFAFPSKCVVK